MQSAPTIAGPAGVGRLGIQLLLTAEVMLFSGLIAAFIVLKSGNAVTVAADRELLDLWIIPAVMSLVIASIVMLRRQPTFLSQLGVLALSAAYLALMGMQWASLEPSSTDVFYACYFLITGTVAAHVAASVIATIDAAVRLKQGRLSEERDQCIAALWHFATIAGVVTTVLLHWA